MRKFAYKDIAINVYDDVFYPTETSKMFIDFFKKHQEFNDENKTILDLGCGSGVVGIILKATGYENLFFASDISENAKLNVLENAKLNNVEITAKDGSLFEPWIGEKFNIIVDDISGIAEDIAKVSEWFGEDISCDSGKDGTLLTKNVLAESKNYLKNDGVIFFPVLTLSNATSIIEYANTIFDSVEEVMRKSFYLPKDFSDKYNNLIVELSEKGHIQVEYKFGMYIWETIIYKASFNKKD